MFIKTILKIPVNISCTIINVSYSLVYIIFKNNLNCVNCVKIPTGLLVYYSSGYLYMYSNTFELVTYIKFISRRLNTLIFPYFLKLYIKGLGYRLKYSVEGIKAYLECKLGFSHLNQVNLPLTVNAGLKKGSVTLFGYSRSTVGNLVAQIYQLRKPNIYTGKGFKYKKQILQLKTIKKS